VLDKATGNFDTPRQLRDEVIKRMNIRPSLSQNEIAGQCGVAPATVSSIIKDIRYGADPVQADLNKLFNDLWRIAK
jgi:hypothetical protein